MLKLVSKFLSVLFILYAYPISAQIKVESSPDCVVVEDTGGNVDIEKNTYNQFYSPTIQLELSKKELEEILFKEELLTKKEQENSNKAYELLLKEQQLKSKSMDFTKWLDFYKKELLILKKKINQLKSKSPDLYGPANDIISTYQKILDSSHCLYEDLDLVAFKDLYGFESVGFEKSEIKNLGYYFFVDEYSESLARVKRLNKYGFIDTEGEEVIPLRFDGAEPFNGGYALVNNDKYYYYINKKGEYKKKKLFGGTSFSQDRVFVLTRDNFYWKLLDKDFERIHIKNIYHDEESIGWDDHIVLNGHLFAKKVYPFDGSGYALFEDGGKTYGFVNVKGEIIGHGYEYLTAFDQNNLAIGKFQKKYGLINRSFKWILDNEYQFIKLAGEGLYLAQKKDGMWAIISKDGDPLTKFQYASFNTKFKYNFIIASRNNKEVVINHNGLEIIPPIFDAVKRIGYNSFEVKNDEGTYEFSFDIRGNCTSTNRASYYQLISQTAK